MTKPTNEELAARGMACTRLSETIRAGHLATLDQCRAAVGDDGDLCLHLFMALQGHITALGYAWDVARQLLNTPPMDGHHWFRRVEVIGQGQVIEILIGGAKARAEVGYEARAMVAAALDDFSRRVLIALQPVQAQPG